MYRVSTSKSSQLLRCGFISTTARSRESTSSRFLQVNCTHHWATWSSLIESALIRRCIQLYGPTERVLTLRLCTIGPCLSLLSLSAPDVGRHSRSTISLIRSQGWPEFKLANSRVIL